ncbi:hypothetical protein K443DRAFT_116388, partial [Laccaria amethystina LaAM-08-1]
VSHWAIPREIWKVMEENKALEEQGRQTKKKKQQILDFKTVTGPREFTRSGILHAVVALILMNNQPLALADNLAFRNALVTMWPKSTTSDLPTSYGAKVHIHNMFVKHMKALKEEIIVSQYTLLALRRTRSYLNRRLLGRSR